MACPASIFPLVSRLERCKKLIIIDHAMIVMARPMQGTYKASANLTSTYNENNIAHRTTLLLQYSPHDQEYPTQ